MAAARVSSFGQPADARLGLAGSLQGYCGRDIIGFKVIASHANQDGRTPALQRLSQSELCLHGEFLSPGEIRFVFRVAVRV